MTVTQDDIADAIELAILVLEGPGKTKQIPIENINGLYNPDKKYGLIAQAQLTDNNVDSTIEELITFFKTQGYPFTWRTSERSTPVNLNEHLEYYGFKKRTDAIGLYLADFDKAIRPNPDITVRLATEADKDEIIHTFSEGFPLPVETMVNAFEAYTSINARHYLAYVIDSEKPVSVASMFYMPDKPIVALQGAATLSSYRGRGIYTSLMAKRLQDARADGMQIAILQGNMHTSAPICLKLGFQKLCNMAVYRWSQEDTEEH